ncbi:hypothetical protein D3C71_976570 [compost metagenome]
MSIVGLQLRRQHLAATESNRSTFDIDQQARTLKCGQRLPVLQPAIGKQQEPLLLRRKTLLPRSEPAPRFAQRCKQRCAATRAETIEPMAQTTGRFQPLNLPLRHMPAGRQQSQARALPIGVIEQLREQTLGIAQRLMPTGRRRGIDDHQPQLMGRTGTQMEQQL